ncbi:MAG: hypothetical protein AAGG50_10105 [Bacteroidota bacterium]
MSSVASTVFLDQPTLNQVVDRLRGRPDFCEQHQGLHTISLERSFPPDISAFDPNPGSGGIRSEYFGSFADTRTLYGLLSGRSLAPSVDHEFSVTTSQCGEEYAASLGYGKGWRDLSFGVAQPSGELLDGVVRAEMLNDLISVTGFGSDLRVETDDRGRTVLRFLSDRVINPQGESKGRPGLSIPQQKSSIELGGQLVWIGSSDLRYRNFSALTLLGLPPDQHDALVQATIDHLGAEHVTESRLDLAALPGEYARFRQALAEAADSGMEVGPWMVSFRPRRVLSLDTLDTVFGTLDEAEAVEELAFPLGTVRPYKNVLVTIDVGYIGGGGYYLTFQQLAERDVPYEPVAIERAAADLVGDAALIDPDVG